MNRPFISLILAATLLSACGQSGDLYVPGTADEPDKKSRFIFEPSQEADYYQASDESTESVNDEEVDFIDDDADVLTEGVDNSPVEAQEAETE